MRRRGRGGSKKAEDRELRFQVAIAQSGNKQSLSLSLYKSENSSSPFLQHELILKCEEKRDRGREENRREMSIYFHCLLVASCRPGSLVNFCSLFCLLSAGRMRFIHHERRSEPIVIICINSNHSVVMSIHIVLLSVGHLGLGSKAI